MDIKGYDAWKLDDGMPEQKVGALCDYCGNELIVGHEYYNDDVWQTWYCDRDCYKRELMKNPGEAIDEYIELMEDQKDAHVGEAVLLDTETGREW